MIGWLFGKRRAKTATQENGVVAFHRDRITVRQQDLFARPEAELCRAFLRRAFSVPEVQQIDIHPAAGTAELHVSPQGDSASDVYRRLAAAIGDPAVGGRASDEARLFLRRRDGATVRVFRHGALITTWQVLHELPGRARFRHDLLIDHDRVATFLEQQLSQAFGVEEVKVRPLTGTLLVQYDAARLGTAQLLRFLESMLHDFHAPRQEGSLRPSSTTALTSASLGLGAAADFVLPALAPSSAFLLILLNLPNLKNAWQDLKRLKAGSSLLYSVILVGTLASGSYFAAALMGWMMAYWERQGHRRLSQAQRLLLAEFQRRPCTAWIRRDGVELEIPVDQLRWGHVVALRAGDQIPIDGIVTEGECQVDERLVAGTETLSEKVVGDWVYASSTVFDGQIYVKVVHVGNRTRAAAMGRMLEQAAAPPAIPLKKGGEFFAGRTVLPTLATAGAGLAVGDLTTALAILRPDYATGPGMAVPFGTLQDLHTAMRRGVIVRNPELFARIREVDVLLFDSSAEQLWPSLAESGEPTEDGCNDRHAAESDEHGSRFGPRIPQALNSPHFDRLRQRRTIEIGLISQAPESAMEPYARQLAPDFWYGGMSHAQKAQLVQHLTAQGKRVAFVGDCLAAPEAAQLAHVAIGFGEAKLQPTSEAHAHVLRPDLDPLCHLWEISEHRDKNHRKQMLGQTLVPNLLCIAGAFFFDFTSLSTVLITNLGVWSVYRKSTDWLRPLEQRMPRNGARGPPTIARNPAAVHSQVGGHGTIPLGIDRQGSDRLLPSRLSIGKVTGG